MNVFLAHGKRLQFKFKSLSCHQNYFYSQFIYFVLSLSFNEFNISLYTCTIFSCLAYCLLVQFVCVQTFEHNYTYIHLYQHSYVDININIDLRLSLSVNFGLIFSLTCCLPKRPLPITANGASPGEQASRLVN